MSFIRLSLLSAIIALSPALAHAYTWTLCMKHAVHGVDSNYGEDFEVSTSGYSNWISRGSKVRLQKSGNWSALGNTNTSTGCVNYTAAAGGPVTIELTAEHSLANGQVVRIRTGYGVLPTTKVWSFSTTLPSNNATLTFYTPYSDESNLAAIAPWVIHRLTGLTGNLPNATNKSLNVYNQNCSDWSNACDGSGFVPGIQSLFIAPDYGHSERKFLVGHEVGHWLEYWWGNGGSSVGGYGAIESDPQCQFAGIGAHGMRSREQDFPAYKEGIAHLISAIAWNDPINASGAFKYYKNQSPHNFETIDLDVAGAYAFNWEGTWCDPKEAGLSVEGDWLRHFWNFLNDPSGSDFQPTMVELADVIATMYSINSYTAATAYASLADAVDAANYDFWIDHWADLADFHGVIDP